jgi:pilus assembly protein CpaB
MAAKPKTAVYVGILAIVIALIASVSLYRYLKGQEEELKKAVATEKIIIAKRDISIGSTIEKAQTDSIDWPRANRPQGAFTATESVIGRTTLERFVAGEPIIEAKLVPRGGLSGVLTYKIPEGHRAMTVGVDQVAGVAGFITPGNMVDVVLTTQPQYAKESISKIVLQNIPVLATGQTVEQQKEGKPVVVPTVTLDVTPEDAERLAIASTQGRLQLVLRGAGDESPAVTRGATITKVMKGAPVRTKKARVVKTTRKKTAKAKPQKQIIRVEIWKQNKMTVKTFTVENL